MRKVENRVVSVVLLVVLLAWTAPSFAHRHKNPETPQDAFEKLDIHGLRSPNSMRTASGAPGPDYWQQRVDYVIDVTLDEEQKQINGSETITYTNNSPNKLTYLWLQIDQNRFRTDSADMRSVTVPTMDGLTYDDLGRILEREAFEGGAEILSVVDAGGEPLHHTVVGTMMRIDLPGGLDSGASFTFSIDWSPPHRRRHQDARAGRLRVF